MTLRSTLFGPQLSRRRKATFEHACALIENVLNLWRFLITTQIARAKETDVQLIIAQLDELHVVQSTPQGYSTSTR